jgi:hypothetical protein
MRNQPNQREIKQINRLVFFPEIEIKKASGMNQKPSLILSMEN